MVLRAHLIVSGSVQSVGFRWFAQAHAKEAGVKGYVKNLDDGTVEIVCESEGEKPYISFLRKIERGDSSGVFKEKITVSSVKVLEMEKNAEPKYDTFSIY